MDKDKLIQRVRQALTKANIRTQLRKFFNSTGGIDYPSDQKNKAMQESYHRFMHYHKKGTSKYQHDRNKWHEMFYIERVTKQEKGFMWDRVKFAVHHRTTNECIGTYDTYRYAAQQAEYRYRKAMNRIEKLLLR